MIEISLFIVGLKLATDKGMILEPIHKAAKKLPNVLYMPVIGCITCMASVWGTVIYWTDLILSKQISGVTPYTDWIITIFGAAALSTLIYNATLFFIENKIE